METYIIQIILFQLVFWLFYEAFLRRETFFNANRSYLLVSSVLSLLLPFVKLSFFANTVPALQKALVIQLPEILIGEQEPVNRTRNITNGVVQLVPESSSLFSIEVLWYIGIGICALLLLYKVSRIYYYKYTNPNQWKGNYLVVWIQNSNEAFSFFNQIFLGDQIEKSEQESILKHEKVHANEWHSLDLLWFELLRIIFWFNPLIYIYQKRITEVHEFIADRNASQNQKHYYEDLLAQTFGVTQFSLVNQFYSSSLIKKRIIMLTKQKSKSIKLVRYFGVLPIVLSMLFYVSCSEVDTKSSLTNQKKQEFTENTVIRDVIKIIEDAIPNNITEKEKLSPEQYKELIFKLKKYYANNKAQLETIDAKKYFNMSMFLISSIKKNSQGELHQEDQDFMNFVMAEMCVSSLLDNIDSKYDDDKKISFATMLRQEKLLSRLKELNYELPNEEEWVAKYKEAKAKEELMSEDVDYATNVDVPFAVLEKSPVYPGCDENGTREELKKCFSQKITEFVAKEFNTKIGEQNQLTGLLRIAVAFKIDKEGNIVEVRARAPHEDLVVEAKRVINSLPKMKPGIHKGKAVTVPYALPIKFKIN
ncbi:M56 family metallopeptidase [Pseudofulvibacter geojedonensis]|uniref:M56 family metallopeptidase n=1 Tax=Pseudofulvibacter geojedonensis TaxID=1123758 RepID=A0ABW3I3J3_9FLAO